jgi:hypothetical protein
MDIIHCPVFFLSKTHFGEEHVVDFSELFGIILKRYVSRGYVHRCVLSFQISRTSNIDLTAYVSCPHLVDP